MSILLRKGQGYNAEYASTDYPVLSSDWTGDISLYTVYPGIARFTKALTRSDNKMMLALDAGDISGLDAGVYYFASTIKNSVTGLSITSVNFATVTDLTIASGPMCRIFVTVAKADGTPAGKQTKTLVNAALPGKTSSMQVVLGWAGVPLSADHLMVDLISGCVIGTERISTTTNAAGYGELNVVQGVMVRITCPSLGKPVDVDTTGLDAIDISEYF